MSASDNPTARTGAGAPAPGGAHGTSAGQRCEIYDTTLRDGSQREGLSLTVEDKLRVARQLDQLGVSYIEGGWPGANPKDDEFFARAPGELNLEISQLVAFGATRRASGVADDDDNLRNLVKANTQTVCIVAKSWDYHVTEALNTTLDEAVAMVRDSVAYLKGKGLDVFLDAEHFFDGFKRNPEFASRVLEAGAEEGADRLVLCDTNGGTLPHEVEAIVAEIRLAFPDALLGCHFHNDANCAVANALAAVRHGVFQVQGCINGYGERTGNANLCSIIPDLTLKMGVETIPRDRLERLTPVAHHIAEIVNLTMDPQQPFVGSSAFAHKAGLHTSAIARASDAYEHVEPDAVGNLTRFVVSELAGRSTVQLRADEMGVELDGKTLADVLETLKNLEHRGYHFEAADGSFELLLRRATGWEQDFFRLESFRVTTEKRADGEVTTEATIKVHAAGERVIATAEGNGPVHALDQALRKAIGLAHPSLDRIHLTDYKVRVLDTHKGTGAVTRVLLDSTDGDNDWSTIGVSDNIIEASWQALSDSIVFGLQRAESDRDPAGEPEDA
ncbi:MAG TPA: citramalate synthase [Acidimicrobiia bacterium]|nr:citramalate synthase [Acidimicrobiia bacterium]